jgi:ribosomal protein S18 acetylase RimI-like enzyme
MADHIDGLHTLRRIDVRRAASVLADAFQHDPVWRKVFEGVTKFADRFRAFFESPLRICLRYGGVYATSGALEGVAAWLPGRHADVTLLRALLSGAAVCGLRIGMDVMRWMKTIGDILTPDRKVHMAGRDYRYLLVIGVATRHQGAGLGTAMVRALTGRCDRDGTWLYLETETERNARLYQKHGFHVLQRIVLPQIDLPMWELARPPGGASR